MLSLTSTLDKRLNMFFFRVFWVGSLVASSHEMGSPDKLLLLHLALGSPFRG